MSSNFELKKTPNTPAVIFKVDEGVLLIEGRSIPENPGDFYDPIMTKVKEYFKENDALKISFKLEYINSGSSKYLLGILRVISEAYKKGKKCQVQWFYEEDDESVYELGEHYKSSFPFPINLIETI
ncbi:MAG: DUF1987 domain-containing protein [Bacteroidota bacterium]